MNPTASVDPFTILGVSPDAGEEDVRARYLDLVKQFPPERDPEKFREIRTAFEAVKDPLSVAKRLIAPPGDEAPAWAEMLAVQRQNPPRFSVPFLLSLGNRPAADPAVQSPVD